MAVAFDAVSNVGGNAVIANVNSASWTHTPAGTPDYVRVAVGWAKVGTNTLTATYGGAAMTSLGKVSIVNGDTSTGYVEVFEKIGPASGAQTVALSWTNTGNYGYAQATTYTGVSQATASGTPVTATGTSTTPSVTVASAAGDMISDGLFLYRSNVVTAGKTGRGSGYGLAASPNSYWGAAQDTTSSGSVAMGWTLDTSTTWAQIGAKIIAAGAASITGPLVGFDHLGGGGPLLGRLVH